MRALWALAALAALRPADAARPRVVIFVVSARQEAPVLSTTDLRQIFLGRITRWKSGQRIQLATRPESTPAGRAFFERVVEMSDIDYSRLWLGIIFRGEAMSSPRVLPSPGDVLRFLARVPDGLSFLLDSELPAGTAVRPLRIDGRSFEDPSYPFRQP
jgi:hypothetical protein